MKTNNSTLGNSYLSDQSTTDQSINIQMPLLDSSAPADKGRTMEKVYFIYGIALVIPSNAVFASLPYFAEKVNFILGLTLNSWMVISPSSCSLWP